MRWLLVTLCLGLAASGGIATELPSGAAPTLEEVLTDEVSGQAWVRFRFVLPELASDHAAHQSYEDVMEDFAPLCTSVALPYLGEHGLAAQKVVISMGDRLVPFGSTDPEATQFFELFSIVDGDCIWEGL